MQVYLEVHKSDYVLWGLPGKKCVGCSLKWIVAPKKMLFPVKIIVTFQLLHVHSKCLTIFQLDQEYQYKATGWIYALWIYTPWKNALEVTTGGRSRPKQVKLENTDKY